MKNLLLFFAFIFIVLQIFQLQSISQDTSDVVWQIYNNRTITKILFSNDSKQIITSTYNYDNVRFIEIRDVVDGALIQELPGESDCTLSRDGTLLITRSNDSILIREYPSLTLVKKIISDGQDGGIYGNFDFSPDNKFLASAADTGGIRIFDIDSGKIIKDIKNFPFKWHPKYGGSPKGYYVKYNQDGTKLLFSGDWAFIYDLSIDSIIHQFDQSLTPTYSQDFTKIGIMKTDSDAVYIYNSETYQEEKRIILEGTYNFNFIFSPDGSRIITSGDNGKLQIWDLDSLIEIYNFHFDFPYSLRYPAISNDGQYIAIESGYLILLKPTITLMQEIYNNILNTIYPNPTTGIVTIEINSYYYSNLILRIADNKGRILNSINLGLNDSGENIYNYNASSLSSGIYYITIQDGSHLQTYKLVKE